MGEVIHGIHLATSDYFSFKLDAWICLFGAWKKIYSPNSGDKLMVIYQGKKQKKRLKQKL